MKKESSIKNNWRDKSSMRELHPRNGEYAKRWADRLPRSFLILDWGRENLRNFGQENWAQERPNLLLTAAWASLLHARMSVHRDSRTILREMPPLPLCTLAWAWNAFRPACVSMHGASEEVSWQSKLLLPLCKLTWAWATLLPACVSTGHLLNANASMHRESGGIWQWSKPLAPLQNTSSPSPGGSMAVWTWGGWGEGTALSRSFFLFKADPDRAVTLGAPNGTGLGRPKHP